MNKAARDLLTEGYSLSIKREKKINSSNVNWRNYKQIAEQLHFQYQMHRFAVQIGF